MIRLAAAALAAIVVVFPLAVLPAAPVTWLAVPAAALGVVGAVALSVALTTGGAALALIAYAVALAIERPGVDPLTALVFGSTLVVLLALVHFAALTDGATLGPGVIAAEIRRWLAIVAVGIVAAVALTLGGSVLAPAAQRVPLPFAVGAAALGAVLVGAGVIALVTRRGGLPAVALSLLLASGAAAEVKPRAVVIGPFDVTSLDAADQWLDTGVTQAVSLGLTQIPYLVQIERARLGVVPAVELIGRIVRTDAGLVIQPIVVEGGQTRLPSPMTLGETDFLARLATLPAAYADALQVPLTVDEQARITRGAWPTRSMKAFELFVQGQMAFDRGSYEDALAPWLRAIEIDGKFPVAQLRLGTAHRALGNRWKTAAQVRAANLLEPHMAEPYKALGDLYLAAPRNLYDQAIEAYGAAIARRPFYADAHVGLGDARMVKGDLDGAIAAYRAALTFDPFSARTNVKLAQAYAKKGQCADSASAFQRAHELDPGATPQACPPVTP